MQTLKNDLWKSNFSHIYIEKGAKDYPISRKILTYFKNATQIEINHYKDVFCRKNQDFLLQKQSIKLILGVKKNNLIYKGPKICQDFGNTHFYYTSCIINCIYNCEYCFLQGMYPSANVVIFVNLEDFFEEVEKLLKQHPVYLCISYDTDLLAFESFTSFVTLWTGFAKSYPDLTIEVRTKSSNFSSIKNIPPAENVILAWTLSPSKIISKYEINTPSLESRLYSICNAIEKGWKVRLCFDPLLYIKDWKEEYDHCIKQTFETLPPEKIYDVSIGVFRVPQDYLKKMQKVRTHSVLLSYPFECYNGVYSYSEEQAKQMIDFVHKKISRYIAKNKIYI